ncbi:MAG: hypothetical protein ACXV2J_15090 [Actinomycetes bacterium]
MSFELGDEFDRDRLDKIAQEARPMFEGMPGLSRKYFTVDEAHRRATNFYVWESEAAARGFFTPELIERVTGLYGVRPAVDFSDVVASVDNSHAPAD